MSPVRNPWAFRTRAPAALSDPSVRRANSRPGKKNMKINTGFQKLLVAFGLLATALAARAAGPTITGFSPSSGPAGLSVDISGTNFNQRFNGSSWSGTPSYKVQFTKFGSFIDASFSYISSTRLRVTVPFGATTGKICLLEGTTRRLSPGNFTITAASKLRIVNNTQYQLIDVRVNNVQKVSSLGGAAPGTAFEFNQNPGSNLNVYLGVGTWNSNGTRNELFHFNAVATVTAGQTTTLTLNRITIPQLLTNFQASQDWVGNYFDGNGALHQARFRFFLNGSWKLFDDGVQIQTGTVSLAEWNNMSLTAKFRTRPTDQPISCFYPFGSFMYRNGPASWPIIEYVRQ